MNDGVNERRKDECRNKWMQVGNWQKHCRWVRGDWQWDCMIVVSPRFGMFMGWQYTDMSIVERFVFCVPRRLQKAGFGNRCYQIVVEICFTHSHKYFKIQALVDVLKSSSDRCKQTFCQSPAAMLCPYWTALESRQNQVLKYTSHVKSSISPCVKWF